MADEPPPETEDGAGDLARSGSKEVGDGNADQASDGEEAPAEGAEGGEEEGGERAAKDEKESLVSYVERSLREKTKEKRFDDEGEQILSDEDEEGGLKEASLSASSAYLIITSVLEEIIDKAVKKAEHYEDASEGSEGDADEAEGEEDEEEEGEEEEEEEKAGSAASIRTISVTTIKSFASKVSETSDLRLARLAEEEQMRREKEAQLKQEEFDKNVKLFNELVKQRAELKRKNAYLTRKMYEFYQLEKIEHLFKEHPGANQEMEARYQRALNNYQEVKIRADAEEKRVNALIAGLTAKHDEAKELLDAELDKFLTKEKDLGQGRVYSATGKVLTDKGVEKVIEQQMAKFAEVDDFRIKYFILRDTVAKEEMELKALDDIGEGCTMKEYELMRLQNQGNTEKLEEKDAELEKLRTKALSAMQILSEVREAEFVTSEDIESERIVLKDVDSELAQTRWRLANEKKRRDTNRFETQRSVRDAGLLAEPKLLKDYKKSENERKDLQEKVAKLREKYARQQNLISSMRSTLSKAGSTAGQNYRAK